MKLGELISIAQDKNNCDLVYNNIPIIVNAKDMLVPQYLYYMLEAVEAKTGIKLTENDILNLAIAEYNPTSQSCPNCEH